MVTRVSHDVEVCFDHGAVTPGQRVVLTRKHCRPMSPKTVAQVCSDETIEAGEVLRATDERCVLMRVAPGQELQVGDELSVETVAKH